MRHVLLSLLAFTSASVASADPITINYLGDKLPSESPYASTFTTVGPGHPTGQYFVGTNWSSDGDVLTMRTQHPQDHSGASSLGIWFGRGDWYNDSPGFNFGTTLEGNRIDARMALGANSSEWSLYWYDMSGFGASLYLLNNGFTYYTAAGGTFVPVSNMTSFHTFGTQVQNGKVYYTFDGQLLGSGNALTGLSNFMLIGDGSAASLSGYGTLKVDSVAITLKSGEPSLPSATVPDSGSTGVLLGFAGLAGAFLRRRFGRR